MKYTVTYIYSVLKTSADSFRSIEEIYKLQTSSLDLQALQLQY
jgi:hypothetical protein